MGRIDEPQTDARVLLMHVITQDRAFLIAHPERLLSREQIEQFKSLLARRADGEPVQYITGRQEFFKLDFEVNRQVLIPRPETEAIVETALELLTDRPQLHFADIGTGSGCLAVSLLREWPNATAIGVDISADALEVAQRNAARHGVMSRLRLVSSDGFQRLNPGERFELIVSNPPYVSDEEMLALQREVRREPPTALAGGPDGFTVIRRLLRDAPPHLDTGGYFIFEIGFSQGETVVELIDSQTWELIEIRRDLAHIPRTVVLRKRANV